MFVPDIIASSSTFLGILLNTEDRESPFSIAEKAMTAVLTPQTKLADLPTPSGSLHPAVPRHYPFRVAKSELACRAAPRQIRPSTSTPLDRTR